MHNKNTKGLALSVAVGALVSCAGVGLGQEAMYTNAATMPIAGSVAFRPQLFFSSYGRDPDGTTTRTDFTTVDTGVQVGLARAWSLTINAPVEYQRDLDPAGDRYDLEVESVDFMFKHRFYMENGGGVDTTRAAVVFGTRLDLLDGFNVDPHLGVVFTNVRGQHGINAELDYLMTTGGTEDRLSNIEGGDGTADLFRTNVSYVFRFWPEKFTSTSTGAWYATAELNGLWETNGDSEVRWSPGLMYEGREVSFECMLQLPVWHDLDERPELDWSVGVGLRILF